MFQKKFKRLFFCLCAVFLTAEAFAASLRIVLVGDLYRIDPDKRGRGGYAKLAGVLEDSRKTSQTLFVHAGDAFSPSLISGVTKGKHVVDLLNQMGLDYFTPGNHEFDFGSEVALERFGEAKFKILSGNILVDGRPIPGSMEVDMVQVGEFKVGIYGLLTTRTSTLNPNADLKIKPLLESAAEFHARLKEAGADFVVALVQTNMEEDMRILASGYADAVLSGDDHVNLAYEDGKRTWLESGEDAKKIAILNLEFSKNDRGRTSVNQSIEVVDTVSVNEDPKIKLSVDRYGKMLDKEFGKVIGTAAVELNSLRAAVRSGESNMGNLIADALRKKLNTDVAITNGGGIRGNKTYPAGNKLTRKDILTELPFGNFGTSLRITGADIRKALENGVSEVENGAGRFPQVSGIVFEFSASAPKGKRVKKILINGKTLNENQSYTVATNDYMMNGGDNYKVFKSGEVLVDALSGELMATSVMEYIESLTTLAPKVEGRIVKLD